MNRKRKNMTATPSQKKRLTEMLIRYPICYQPGNSRELVFCDPINKEFGRILGVTGKARVIQFYKGTMSVRRVTTNGTLA